MKNDVIGNSEIATNCIICNEKIILPNTYSPLVPRVCEECREAVLFQRRFLQAIDDYINRKCD